MNWKKYLGGLLTAGSLALVVAFVPSQTVLAQGDGGMLQVAEVKVKDGQVAEFIDLQRQYAAAGKAAGQSGRDIWQVVRGQSNTFHVVDSVENFASIDEGLDPPMSGEDWARWVARITQTIDSRTVRNLRVYPNLVIPAADGAVENLAALRIRTVLPGNNGAYEEWIEDDLLPALRAGGQTGVSYFRTLNGGNTNTWFGVTRHANWAEMDPPGPLADMSERQRNSLLEKAAELQTGTGELHIIRHRADLSF